MFSFSIQFAVRMKILYISVLLLKFCKKISLIERSRKKYCKQFQNLICYNVGKGDRNLIPGNSK